MQLQYVINTVLLLQDSTKKKMCQHFSCAQKKKKVYIKKIHVAIPSLYCLGMTLKCRFPVHINLLTLRQSTNLDRARSKQLANFFIF